jgi:hypothetical protein
MLPVAITAGVSIIQGIQSLTGGSEEPKRLAANQDAFSKAAAGNADALAFLKQRSGKFGTAFVSGYGSIGGWATKTAQDDAWSKYQTILTSLAASDSIGSAVGDTAQSIAQATGNTIVPGTKSDVTVTLLVLGVVIWIVAQKAKRG